MPGSSPFQTEPGSAPWKPQFSLRSLLLVLFLCSLVAALLGALIRNVLGGETDALPIFVVVTIAGPLAAVVLIGMTWAAARLLSILGGRTRRDDETQLD